MGTLSAQQVANKYGINKSTVVRHIQAGKLQATKRLNAYVIKSDDAKKWAKSQGLV